MAAAAWLGEVGVRAAARAVDVTAAAAPGTALQELMVVHAGLVDLRRILRNVGGNLNDVARHANTTGALAAETAPVQALVARVVRRVDVALAELHGVMVVARRSQRAGWARAPAAVEL